METEKNKKDREEKKEIKIAPEKKKEEKQEMTEKKSPKKAGEEVFDNQKKISKDEYPKDQYLYVYGITTNEDIQLDLKGLQDKPIQKLDFGDMSVLFSFYPDLHPIVEESEAMLHAEILNKLAGKITIIPMAFGTVFKDQEILETVLASSHQAIKKTLQLIKDKIELGVKIVKNSPSEEIAEVLPETSQNILGELNELSVKNIQGDRFSDRLLLNHFFLVEKNKFDEFSDKIGELERKYQNLKFMYTGPWPAYSFVNINIKVG